MPSTAIRHFHYDEATKTLRVVFISGTVYDYKPVPPELFEKMRSAGSKGKFLNRWIKGKFPFEKIG